MKESPVKRIFFGTVLALSISIVAVFNILAITIGFFVIDDINSENTKLVQQEASPDGEHIAYVIYVYGGATTPDTCQIKIAGKHSKYTPLMRGNVYVCTVGMKVEWVSDEKLRVTYDDSGNFDSYGFKTYKKEYEYKGIEIDYRIDSQE